MKKSNALRKFFLKEFLGLEVILIFLSVGFVVLFFLYPRLNSSFWLDECNSYWVVRDGFNELFSRLYRFQNNGPLYFVLLWIAKQIYGLNEFALRLISVFFFLGANYYLWNLAKFYIDKRAAYYAVFFHVYLCTFYCPNIFDLRPYAMGIFGFIGSIYFFEKWLRTNELRDLIKTVCLWTFAFYANYLFTISILVLLYCLVIANKKNRLIISHLCLSIFVLIILCSSGFIHLLEIAKRSNYLYFIAPITFPKFIDSSLALILIFPLILILIYAKFFNGVRNKAINKNLVSYFIFWGTFPCLFFALLYYALDKNFYIPRYFLWSFSGWSLLAAYVISFLSRFCSILVTFLCVLISILKLFYSALPGEHEDWKAAVEFVSKHNTDLNLVYSGLIESKYPQYYVDDESISYLSSPWRVYTDKENFYPINLNDDSKTMLLNNLINKNIVGAIAREYKDPENLYCTRMIDFMEKNEFRVVQKSFFNGTCGVIFNSVK